MKHCKTVLVIVLAVVLFSVTIQPLFAASRKMPFYGKVTATRLNIRENPNTKAEVFGQVENGDEVLFVEMRKTTSGQWYYVMVTGELEGWALGKYIQYKRPANF